MLTLACGALMMIVRVFSSCFSWKSGVNIFHWNRYLDANTRYSYIYSIFIHVQYQRPLNIYGLLFIFSEIKDYSFDCHETFYTSKIKSYDDIFLPLTCKISHMSTCEIIMLTCKINLLYVNMHVANSPWIVPSHEYCRWS